MGLICLYSNSVGVFPKNVSYGDLLDKKVKNLVRVCEAGMTICEAIQHYNSGCFKSIPPSEYYFQDRFKHKDVSKYIVNLGVVGAATRRIDNFLNYLDEHVSRFGKNLLEDYTEYKRAEAAAQPVHACEKFMSIFTKDEFRYLHRHFINMLVKNVGGKNILQIGLLKTTKKKHRYETAVEFNNILLDISNEFGTVFLDCMNLPEEFAFGDDQHLNEAGHKYVFNTIISDFLESE